MNELDPTERALAALFARQAAAVATSVPESRRPVARTDGARAPRRRPAVVGVAAAAAVVIVAITVGVLRAESPAGGPSTRGARVDAGVQLELRTNRADLIADGFAVTNGARRFTGDDVRPVSHSDPGTPTYWSLESRWLTLYFTADGRDWWVDEIRARAPGLAEVTYRGEFFRSRLGAPFTGDLDVTDPATGTRLRLTDARLTVSPAQLDCTGLPRPMAVRDDLNGTTVGLRAGGTALGDELQLVDTVRCVIAVENDRATFTSVSRDPTIAEFAPGDCSQMVRAKCERGALPEMIGRRVGRTVVTVTARDGAGGKILATSEITVVVCAPDAGRQGALVCG